jgi:hypothetical protein
MDDKLETLKKWLETKDENSKCFIPDNDKCTIHRKKWKEAANTLNLFNKEIGIWEEKYVCTYHKCCLIETNEPWCDYACCKRCPFSFKSECENYKHVVTKTINIVIFDSADIILNHQEIRSIAEKEYGPFHTKKELLDILKNKF